MPPQQVGISLWKDQKTFLIFLEGSVQEDLV
jgi:hypothetical protein